MLIAVTGQADQAERLSKSDSGQAETTERGATESTQEGERSGSVFGRLQLGSRALARRMIRQAVSVRDLGIATTYLIPPFERYEEVLELFS